MPHFRNQIFSPLATLRCKRTFVAFAVSQLILLEAASGDVSISLGTGTGANTKIDTSRSYTYNFGVTSAGAGLILDDVSMYVGIAQNQTNPIIVEIFSGFGGNVTGNTLLQTTSIPATTFTGTNKTLYPKIPLSAPLTLQAGAYSLRVSSAAATTAGYVYSDGALTLGGNVVTQEKWIQDSNTTGTAGTTIAPAAGYVLADHSASASSVDLGRYHTGGSAPTSAVTLSNSAPATTGSVTESLVVAQGTLTGNAAISSLPGSHLTQGSTHQVSVGLSGAGSQTGSVQLNFTSVKDGSSSIRAGTDPVAVGSRTIELSGFGYTGQSVWIDDANGSWTAAGYDKWDNAGGTPGMDGAASVADTALFGNAATAARTITLDGNNPGVSTLTFDNSTSGYTIAQGSGGTLTVGNATNAGTITNTAGNHTISAPITLGSNITMSSSEGSLLQISGAISGSHGITKQGVGQITLDGTNTYTGTTTVSAGTLRVNGTTGSGVVTVAQGARLEGIGRSAVRPPSPAPTPRDKARGSRNSRMVSHTPLQASSNGT